MSLLLLGAGPMAVEYSKVLIALGQEFTVIGRSSASAEWFKEKTGIDVRTKGLESMIQDGSIKHYTSAIVAVSEEMLGIVTRQLIENGIRKILVEKPGGLSVEDIEKVRLCSEKYGAKVYVGYNRRYYASVVKTKEIIAEDGGATSFHFEFTEWSNVIEPLEKGVGVKEEWFLANSTHVIDLAFYLTGYPAELTSYVSDALPWHSKGAIYAGAGKSISGALFTYSANWKAPGRWGIEIMTCQHRLYLRPLERLQVQNLGEVTLKDVEIDDQRDIDFKPGIFKQTECFLYKQEGMLTIGEQCEMLKFYKLMRGDN